MTLPSSHAFRQPSKKCLVCIVQLTVFLDQKHHQNLSWRVGKFKYYKPLKTQNNVKRKSYDKTPSSDPSNNSFMLSLSIFTSNIF